MVHTLSKAEYLKASRGLAAGFGPTVDFTDQSLGTTSQSEGGIGVSGEELPGQVFSVDQLPDPEIARGYGLPPVTIPEHLILEDGDGEDHVQGKDPQDIATAELRRKLKDPVLAFDGVVRPADDAMTSFSERTGENAFADRDGEDEDNGKSVDPEGVQKAPGARKPAKTGDKGVESTEENARGVRA